MRNNGKKIDWNKRAQKLYQNVKRKLREAPELGILQKGRYVLDIDVSVVVISTKVHLQQERIGTTVICPIEFGSKVLRVTEMKKGSPKAEIFFDSHARAELSH